MKIKMKILFASAFCLLLAACNTGPSSGGDAATSDSKDKDLQDYKMSVEKNQAKNRFPGDTLALKEYIQNNYPAGTYLMESEKTVTFNLPKEAVIYYKGDANYIFALIVKSKPGERNVEAKNVTGYSSSFVNLDSTKLGTAFFWLTLFEYDKDGNFKTVWEAQVPIHGGFNTMKLKKWEPKNTLYVELNYMDGIISGYRDFNFFLVDGIRNPPHLLETYEGIEYKRVIADIKHDKYPGYWEYTFNVSHWKNDSLYTVRILDSIPFYWNPKKQLYVTDKTKRYYRKY